MPVIAYARLWGLIAAYVALTVLLFSLGGLSLDVAGAQSKLTLMALTGIALFMPWLEKAWIVRVADTIACWGMITLLSTAGALISYAVAAGTHGWSDAWLASMDRALGFDWVETYRFVAARPRLNWLLKLCYLSIFVSPVVVIAGLTLSGKGGAARAFVFAFGIALAITLVAYRFFPARSALAYHLGTDVDFMPVTGIGHIAAIEQLRAGRLTVLPINQLLGMITFPSFHAAAAVLLIWAGWGVRWLRVPMAAINIGMLIATPVQGTHYLVDVIAGAAVALVSIAALHIRPRSTARRRLRVADATPTLAPA